MKGLSFKTITIENKLFDKDEHIEYCFHITISDKLIHLYLNS